MGTDTHDNRFDRWRSRHGGHRARARGRERVEMLDVDLLPVEMLEVGGGETRAERAARPLGETPGYREARTPPETCRVLLAEMETGETLLAGMERDPRLPPEVREAAALRRQECRDVRLWALGQLVEGGAL